MIEMIKKISQIEQKEKSIEQNELQLSIQKDLELEEEDKRKMSKRERELHWILNGGKYPE